MSFPLRWGSFLIIGVVGCGGEYQEPLAPAIGDPAGPQAGPPPGGGSPPIVTVTSPAGGATLAVATPVLFSADFTDPDIGDTHTCSFDWQGSSSPGAVTESGGVGTCAISQTFPLAGGYQVIVSVFDNAGEMGVDTVNFTISAAPPPPPPPSAANTVHGEGRLASPRHRHGVRFHLAARAAHERRGIKGGLSVDVGTLRFASTEIDQLVFSGDRADVTGRGRVARRGQVSFAIALVDGARSANPGPDRVRIRIWNSQEVLLDTEPGLAQSASPTGVPNPGRVVIRP